MGQDNCTADLLVSVTAVNAQTDVQLDGLIKLSLSGLAADVQSLIAVIQLGTVDQLSAVNVVLTVFHYSFPPVWYIGCFPPTNSEQRITQ
ncbi:hypothetical protein EVA_08727 [gut metagenome]|uniref:Uncharacterized protein n=1 Tax=gut metagenome TaxID=749906 RepID=J9GLU8_9ZZZZ